MSDVLVEVDQLAAQAAADLSAVNDANALEQFRIKYLGSNGSVKRLMEKLRAAPKDQKAALGQRINAVKNQVTEAFDAKKGAIGKQAAAGRDAIDVTEPGKRPEVGNRHILMKVVDELTELFGRMGFSIETGPEVEDEFHNFIALNIPKEHPARDPLDNFYLTTATADGGVKPVDFPRADPGRLLLAIGRCHQPLHPPAPLRIRPGTQPLPSPAPAPAATKAPPGGPRPKRTHFR